MSSDEEFEYEYSDEELDYDEEDGADDDAIEMENKFYEAEDGKHANPETSLAQFEEVVALEAARGDEVKWRFKSLLNIVLLKNKLGVPTLLDSYQALLGLVEKVTTNESTDAINTVLDTMGSSVHESFDVTVVSKLYEVTLAYLKRIDARRLWFTTNVKLGQLLSAQEQWGRVGPIVEALHATCRQADGSDDITQATNLMQVYALELRWRAAVGDKSRTREIHERVQRLSAAVSDPRIMGGIHEAFGLMHMADDAWEDAYNELFDAFKSHQDAGNPRAKKCLQYLVLSNMVGQSDIDPFNSREAKVFKDDPEIQAMLTLRRAFEGNDIALFNRTLHHPQYQLDSDPVIAKYMAPLIHTFRCQAALQLCKPYTVVRLSFLAKHLHVSEPEAEKLLVGLILSKRLDGQIDQISACVHLRKAGSGAQPQTHAAIKAWSDKLAAMRRGLAAKLGR
jgi:COP9 signalosome complex subunit 2